MLQFDPVVRKCVRHDGWLPERQREFIVALTVLGNAGQAAIAVGGTMSGAYKLRTAEGGSGFARSWDAALALHLLRHPRPEPKGRPSRGELQSGTGRKAWPADAAPSSAPSPDGRFRHAPPEPPEMSPREFLRDLSRRYLIKLRQEREARLEGRVVEADFYVRQLTWIEIVADLGGNADELLEALKRGGVDAIHIAATPMSAYLEKLRRLYWQEKGEADRPPAPPIGEQGSGFGTGPLPFLQLRPRRRPRRLGSPPRGAAPPRRRGPARVGGESEGGVGGVGEAGGGGTSGRRRGGGRALSL